MSNEQKTQGLKRVIVPADIDDPREGGRYVVDRSGVLAVDIGTLDRRCRDLVRRELVEVLLITVPQVLGPPEAFASETHRHWYGERPGHGLIALLVTEPPRRLVFHIGAELQRRGVTYGRMQHIASESMLPLLRAGQVGAAGFAMLTELERLLTHTLEHDAHR